MNLTKKFLRVIAFVLFAVIALQLPTFALPADYGLANETEQSDVSSDGSDPFGDGARIIGEDESLRTEDTKHFILSNGTKIAARYEVPVHYEVNGEWKDIDNTLTLQDSVDADDIKGFVNTASGVRFKFASNSKSAKLFRMKFDEYEVSWGLASNNVNNVSPVVAGKPSFEDLDENERATALENLSSVVRYANVFDGVDIEYVVRGNDVKENIVIKEKQDSYSYKFEIKTKKLNASLEEDGSVSLKNNSGETVLVIPSPFMYDANGEPSQNVSFELVAKNGSGKYELTVTADKTWVDNAAFPVTVDPYLCVEKSKTAFETSWFTASKPNAHTETYSFIAGKKDGTKNRGYIKVLALPALSPSDVVTNASLVMCQGGSIFPTNTESKGVFVYEATKRSAQYPTWDNSPMDSEALDYNKRTIANETYLSYNITRAAKKWYKNPTSNYGLIFVGSNENSSSDAFIRYWGEDNGAVYRPRLYVSYLNCRGIENYQSYHTSSAASAGTGYVNDFSGDLTFVHTDFVGSGSRMPISISHIYNSSVIDNEKYFTNFYTQKLKSGKGWKMNFQVDLNNVKNDPNAPVWETDATYVYTDEDGTQHYFILGKDQSATAVPRTYYCETDSDLELAYKTVNGNNLFVLTNTKTHYTKTFNQNLYISSQSDNNGNTITYNYDNTWKVLSLNDGSGRVYTFEYDSDNRVTKITAPDGKAITYSYNSNGELTTVTYPWGKTSTYKYENGLLTKATDTERNYSVKYEYGKGVDARKVVKVTEYGGETAGITLGITYNDNATTVFRTAGSDDVYGTADDLLTTYGFDYLGRCVVAYTTDLDKNNIYGVSSSTFQNSNKVSTGNKITESASIGMYSPNLLADPSFETSVTATPLDATLSLTADEHYFGSKSLKITVGTAKTNTSGAKYLKSLSEEGKYTFSAYVKLSDITKAANDQNSGLAIKTVAPNGTVTEKVFRFESDNTGKWQRIEFPFEVASSGNTAVIFGLKNASGTLYADMVQFEKGDCATYPNAVINGSFGSDLSGWITSGSKVSYSGGSLRINGDFITNSYAEQTIVVNDNISDSFILSGWGKATSAQTLTAEQENTASSDNHNIKNKTGTRFMLKATVKYDDKNTSTGAARTNRTYTVEIPFNDQYTGWQFVSKPIIVKPDDGYEVTKINTITIAAVYANNLNTAYFDNIALVRDVAYSYTYDSNGNVISTQALKEQKSKLEYNKSNDLITQNNASGYNYSYEYYDDHNLKSSTSESGIKTFITYDENGNAINTKVSGTTDPDNIASPTNDVIYSSATYSENGQYIISLTDSRGKVTTRNINETTGVLNSTTDANGNTVSYEYDDRYRVTRMYSGATDIIYEYMNGSLSKIKTKATNFSDTDYEEYVNIYDAFGNKISVSVGNITLSTNHFAPNNGKLTSSTYGNGVTVNYFYDHLDRVVKKCYNNNEDTAFLYLYNGLGALSSVTDTATQEKISYVYDTVGRPSETRTEKGDNIFRVLYGYDEISRPNSLTYKYNNAYTQKYSTSYIADNRITLFKLNNGQSDVFSIVPTFDTLGRQTSRTLKNGSGAQVDKEVYSFLAGAGGANASTSMVSSVGYYGSDSTVDETYTYTYDNLGNIKTVSKNGTQIAAYTYNSFNMLTGYTDADGNTYTYGYSSGKNISETGKYLLFYTDDVWLDRVTCITDDASGKVFGITYDGIGNTLSYRDGMSFTWKNGRQLATFTQGQTSASYDYNESGIRNKKTVNGVTTTFQLAGSMIVSENRNGNIIQYYYNEAGSVIGFRYNGNDYFFRRTVNGDIIAILNTSGEVVVTYEYDPWGNILSTSGSMAATLGADNPFRYRGYYYDTESGLYYLQTRYYDPAVGRFINADGFTSTGQGFLGNNMYAYCLNNPISYTDPSGRASRRVFVESQTEGAIIFQESIGNPERIPYKPSKKNSNSAGGAIIDKKVPPDHPDYKPPKGGPRWVKVPNSSKYGWLAKNGDIWIPDNNMHGGEGWVVQPRHGEHSHAYPGGGVRNHFVNVDPGFGDYLVACGCLLGAGALALDDVLGFGVADDVLIPELAAAACFVFVDSGGERRCEICGEVYDNKYGY